MATIRKVALGVATLVVSVIATRAQAQPPYGDRVKMWIHDLDSPVGEVRAGASDTVRRGQHLSS